MPDWKQCEGELAGGEFPLERLLDGREGSAVFLTRSASGKAVIKLVVAGQEQAAEMVERWNRAATLRHPHLVRILAAGTWALEGTPLAYFAMEYAEENLAEVLRERPLTTDEIRDLLPPVVDALAYLHGQGLVHGSLKPSNILAVEDTVKISSEEISAGDPAADIEALGVTLLQALTPPGGQRPTADALPFPFREIAQNCLQHDPRLRWSAARIGDWLRSPERPAPPQAPAPTPATTPVSAPLDKPRGYRYYAAAAVLVVGAAIALGLVLHRTAAPEPAAVELSPPAPAPTQPVPPATQDAITHRVLPDIPALARNTVHGVATVVVRVAVDPSGNVTEATQEGGGSRYFGKLALEAARQWQFAPVKGAGRRKWVLRFEITPSATQVIPAAE
jgi:TonB family protein